MCFFRTLIDSFKVNSAHLGLQSVSQRCIYLPPLLFLIDSDVWADSFRGRDGGLIWMSGGHIPPAVSKGRVIPGRGHYKERARSRQSHFTQTPH